MDTHRQLLSLVDAIYAAAVDVARWPAFLDQLIHVLQGSGCSLTLRHVQQRRTEILASVGTIGADFVAEYGRFAEHDPWLLRGRGGQDWYTGQVGLGEALVPHSELQRTAFFNEFGRRHEYIGGITAILVKNEDLLAVVSCIPRLAARFDEHEATLIHLLMPHLQRAMQVHQRLAVAEGRVTSLAEMLDRLHTAAALVDGDSRVLFANRSAARLFDEADGIGLDRGCLTTARPALTTRLRETMRRAARARTSTAWDAGAHLELGRPSGKAALRLLISPLSSRQDGHSANHVLVFITDPARVPVPRQVSLEQAFGFTPAEAAVALLLLQNHAPREIAAMRRVSVAAIRYHLRQLLAKTGTRRQSELLRLLAAVSQPLEHDDAS